MKLYVIRHGNTDSNRLDIYNGKLLNEDINDIGIKQAQEASKKFRFDYLFTTFKNKTYL